MAPRVSTEDRRVITALRWLIRHMPRARLSVATTGSPSGTAATASATPVWIMAIISCPRRIPAKMVRAASTKVSQTSRWPSRSSRFSSGAVSLSALCTRSLMRPSSVSMPVATTSASPVPCVIDVPLKAMQARSPGTASCATSIVDLPVGIDSPVSTDSSACRFEAWLIRKSAVTTSPASRITTSPGTSSCASTMR